jgi:hypothetical protein
MRTSGSDRKSSPQYRIRNSWSDGAEKIRAITTVFKNGKPYLEDFPPDVKSDLDADQLRDCMKILKQSHGGILHANRINKRLIYDDEHIKCYERLNLFMSNGGSGVLPESQGYTVGFKPSIQNAKQLWDAIADLMNAFDKLCNENEGLTQKLNASGHLGTSEHTPNDDPYFWPIDPQETNIASQLPSHGLDSDLTLQDVADLWGSDANFVRQALNSGILRRWMMGFNLHEAIQAGIDMGGFFCSRYGFVYPHGELFEDFGVSKILVNQEEFYYEYTEGDPYAEAVIENACGNKQFEHPRFWSESDLREQFSLLQSQDGKRLREFIENHPARLGTLES